MKYLLIAFIISVSVGCEQQKVPPTLEFKVEVTFHNGDIDTLVIHARHEPIFSTGHYGRGEVWTAGKTHATGVRTMKIIKP